MIWMSREIHEAIRRHHSTPVASGQCWSINVKHVQAPLPVVWALVRCFDRPQAYKVFLRSCEIRDGNGSGPGSVRQVRVWPGFPPAVSEERLDVLDDEGHVMSFSIIGGNHRLNNYRSTMSVHESGNGGSVVLESYVVDVPLEFTREEMLIFVDTIVKCNLRSLARVAESSG